MSVRELLTGLKDSIRSGRKAGAWRAGIVMLLIALVGTLLMLSLDSAAAIESAGDGDQDRATTALGTTRLDFHLPGTQPNSNPDPATGGFTPVPDPASCSACHGAPSEGQDPIYGAWRGSMMGQAGRDPIFWAAFAVARQDVDNAGEYCLRCHVPKGWLEGRLSATDGSTLTDEDIGSGVACEVCHRMVDPVPGANDELAEVDIEIRAAITSTLPAGHVSSAMMIIDPVDRRRGPFALPNFGIHSAFQSNFQNQGQDAVAASRLCGTCHNVDNPVLSWTENPPGGGPAQYWPNEMDEPAPSFANGDLFPVERTYDEWLNSDYAKGGVYAPQFAGAQPGGIVAACQDCHMTRTIGPAAKPFLNPVFRDCNTTGCLPAHILVGGNTWAPLLLQDSRWRLHNAADAPYLDQTIIEARSMLRRAATVTTSIYDDAGKTWASVRVVNETGHKLPTGYPEGRRMWLNLRAYDDVGNLLYESGAYDNATGILTLDPAIRVYEVKQGLTPELAAVVGKAPGATFHFTLNNMTVKDNRIPPRGYTVADFDQPGLRPVGAAFADGQYWDDSVYEVPGETARVVATLYYQTSSKDYIDFLRANGGADGATLGLLWDDSMSPPELVAQAEYPPPNNAYIPLTSGR